MTRCPACGVPFYRHLGVAGTCESLCKLEAAIEAHCRGERVDEEALGKYGKFMNDRLDRLAEQLKNAPD